MARVETAQVIVVSSRRKDQDGALSLPAGIGEVGSELVAFAGVAKVEITGFFVRRETVSVVQTTALSAAHPLINMTNQTARVDFVRDGDIVVKIGDGDSSMEADRRLAQLGKRIDCIRRGSRITSAEVLQATEEYPSGVFISNLKEQN